ncbi:MAG: hypothetical protein AAF456_11885 [Planctomycetota bacterium]
MRWKNAFLLAVLFACLLPLVALSQTSRSGQVSDNELINLGIVAPDLSMGNGNDLRTAGAIRKFYPDRADQIITDWVLYSSGAVNYTPPVDPRRVGGGGMGAGGGPALDLGLLGTGQDFGNAYGVIANPTQPSPYLQSFNEMAAVRELSGSQSFDMRSIYPNWVGQPQLTVDQIRAAYGDSAEEVLRQLVRQQSAQNEPGLPSPGPRNSSLNIDVEVQFLGLSDDFFEPIGVEFDTATSISASINSGIYENRSSLTFGRRRNIGASGPFRLQSLIALDLFGAGVEETARVQNTTQLSNHDPHTTYGCNLRFGFNSEARNNSRVLFVSGYGVVGAVFGNLTDHGFVPGDRFFFGPESNESSTNTGWGVEIGSTRDTSRGRMQTSLYFEEIKNDLFTGVDDTTQWIGLRRSRPFGVTTR